MGARVQLQVRRVVDAAAAGQVRDLLARAKARVLQRTLAQSPGPSKP